MELVCPVCNSVVTSVFYEMTNVPVHIGVQWPQKDMALNCPKGDIRLTFCRNCAYVWNSAFDPALVEYSEAYDNSLHFSPLFREYALSLATRLIDRYDVRNKNVIDIGCGKGDFLVLVCEQGNNRGVGFDTSYEGERVEHDLGERITFIQDYYSEDYAAYAADLVCCRYVFEHIYDPKEFLTMLRRTLGNRLDTAVFIEVPNLQFIIRDLSIWDIIYEHYSYFSDVSLLNVFLLCGFDNCEVNPTYDSQFLTIDALPSKERLQIDFSKRDGLIEISDSVDRFAENAKNKLSDWQEIQARIEKKGQRAVVWGAGAKGVSFLNVLNLQDQIEFVVDINPYKQGKYIGGSGQQIVAPDFMREHKPDVIIVMNSIYESEIRQMVTDLGLEPEFLCV